MLQIYDLNDSNYDKNVVRVMLAQGPPFINQPLSFEPELQMMIKVFLSEEHNVHLHCNNETRASSSWLKINNTHTTTHYTHYTLDDEYSMFHVQTYKGLSPSMNYC